MLHVITLIGAVSAVLLLVALFVLPRLLAARQAAPAVVQVTGMVPAAADWIPSVLQEFARTNNGTSTWGDAAENGLLSGHRGEVLLPNAGTTLAVTLQPHPIAAEVPAGTPLRISTTVAESRWIGGLPRLVYGKRPVRQALTVRNQLQLAVRERAAMTGATAVGATRGGASAVATLLTILLIPALLAAAAEPAGKYLLPLLPFPSATPTPTPTPPAGYKACTPGKTAGPPGLAWAGKSTTCAFAESVRVGYVKKKPKAGTKTVTLTGILDNKTKRSLSCAVGPLISCTTTDKKAKRLVMLR